MDNLVYTRRLNNGCKLNRKEAVKYIHSLEGKGWDFDGSWDGNASMKQICIGMNYLVMD